MRWERHTYATLVHGRSVVYSLQAVVRSITRERRTVITVRVQPWNKNYSYALLAEAIDGSIVFS